MRQRTVHKLQGRVFDPGPHILVEALVYNDQVRRRVARAVEVPIPRAGGFSMQDVTTHPVAPFARRLNALELISVDALLRFRAHRVAGAECKRARLHPSALAQRSWKEGDQSVGQLAVSALDALASIFGFRLLTWCRVDRRKREGFGHLPWTRARERWHRARCKNLALDASRAA